MTNDGLSPREAWRINPLRRCYERGAEDRSIRVYPCEGGFVVSVFDCWVEGVWPTFEEASAAADKENS